MKHLEPIQYHPYQTKATQTLAWGKGYGWSTDQTTHNIMYNIDAIMRYDSGTYTYTFNDGSELVEYPDRGLFAFKP